MIKRTALSLAIICNVCLLHAQSAANLTTALTALKNHITGTAVLSGAQILKQDSIIKENDSLYIASSAAIIQQSFDLVSLYDSIVGPLFINTATANGLSRTVTSGKEIHFALFTVQQSLIDFAYSSAKISQFSSTLNGLYFKTSSYFPGTCSPPGDPNSSGEVAINASQPAPWGAPPWMSDEPAKRPAGFYVAPGSIVSVMVPASLVNKGFSIRVGAHSWDLRERPPIKRLDRVSIVYPITATVMQVANPLGGGIYIEVPFLANAGIVTVRITGAVRSPFFSSTPHRPTSIGQWQTVERTSPGPWADFESQKFMMQVPTNWIYNFPDAVSLMASWDLAMDGVSELLGRPLVRANKTVLYVQADVTIRAGVYSMGYPQSNTEYNPRNDARGNSTHWLLKAGRSLDNITFHELGHAEAMSKFNGEREAVNNLLWCAIQNRKFNMSLDSAFALSFGGNPKLSIDQVAIMWMVAQNFRDGKPMDITGSVTDEVQYQQRGWGKYVATAKLFGWDALNDFWYLFNADYMKGIKLADFNNEPRDNRILRMSRTAGADLRPLIHFWGVHPLRNDTLKLALEREGLRPSAKIYDELVHYKTLIPMDNQQFRTHAAIIHPTNLPCSTCDTNYAEGWYTVWLPRYTATHGTAAQAALQNIIDLYFPSGRPTTETTPPSPNPATFAVAPKSLSLTTVSMTATAGIDPSGPVMYLFRESSGNPGATTSSWQSSPVYADSGLTNGHTYIYSVRIRDALGNIGAASAPVSVVAGGTSVKDGEINGLARMISRPTSRGVTIASYGNHSVAVYDMAGKQLFLRKGTRPTPYPFASFRNVHARGVYVVRIITVHQNSSHLVQMVAR